MFRVDCLLFLFTGQSLPLTANFPCTELWRRVYHWFNNHCSILLFYEPTGSFLKKYRSIISDCIWMNDRSQYRDLNTFSRTSLSTFSLPHYHQSRRHSYEEGVEPSLGEILVPHFCSHYYCLTNVDIKSKMLQHFVENQALSVIALKVFFSLTFVT